MVQSFYRDVEVWCVDPMGGGKKLQRCHKGVGCGPDRQRGYRVQELALGARAFPDHEVVTALH
jgi:hypothetical protein